MNKYNEKIDKDNPFVILTDENNVNLSRKIAKYNEYFGYEVISYSMGNGYYSVLMEKKKKENHKFIEIGDDIIREDFFDDVIAIGKIEKIQVDLKNGYKYNFYIGFKNGKGKTFYFKTLKNAKEKRDELIVLWKGIEND